MDLRGINTDELNSKLKEVSTSKRGVSSQFHKRGSEGKLTLIKGHCKNCHHERLFEGNPMGQMIVKCARCKHYV